MYKKPMFWKSNRKKINFFLLQVSKIYSFFHKMNRYFRNEIKIDIPVICIGNIVIGGAGKTPVTQTISKILYNEYPNNHILLRNYIGKNKNPKILDEKDSFIDFGDESILHKEITKVCVSNDRRKGAELCIKNDADLLILDDGFQSKHIKKDLSFIVLDFNYHLGNKQIFPAGPLRESLKFASKRIDALIMIDYEKAFEIEKDLENIPIFHSKRIIKIPKIKSKHVFAFCGIGNPDNFFNSLKKSGIVIRHKKEFPDHHIFKNREIEEIIYTAKENNLEILTTKKDFIKIKKDLKKKIKYVDLEIKFQSSIKLKEFIKKKIKSKTYS